MLIFRIGLAFIILGSIFPVAFSTLEDNTSFGLLKIDKDQLAVSEDTLSIIQITGQVNNYSSGHPIYFNILKPDDSTSQIKIFGIEGGSFSTSLLLDANWFVGDYTINGIYRENVFGTVSFKILEVTGPELLSSFNIGTIKIEKDQFTITTDKLTIDVYGNVPNYEEAQLITIELKGPDDFNKSFSITAKKNGDYVVHISADKTWPIGLYHVSGMYNSKEIGTVAFDLKKLDIPNWVRNNAKWWAASQISDSDFARGLEYLIKQGIITIPAGTQSEGASENQIPSWLKKNAGWWGEGQLSDDEFVKSIQWLITNGIIRV